MANVMDQAPVCDITGLPLPIFPLELAQRRALLDPADYGEITDYHHPWFERTAPELQGVYGNALRMSYGQDVNQRQHGFFTRRFEEKGPQLPDTSRDKILLTILGVAHVVPRRSVFLPNSGDHEIIELTDDEYRFLASTVHVEKHHHPKSQIRKRNVIGWAFAMYFMEQDIENLVSRREMGRFLSSRTSEARRKELGNLILTRTMNATLRQFEPIHNELSAEGFVVPSRVRSLGKTVRTFFTKDRYPDYHDTLEQKLLACA